MNWKAILTSAGRFTPLERIILDAVGGRLSGQAKALFDRQKAEINHVQRLPGWDEIDFYALRFPRRVRWNPRNAFPNKSEFILAACSIKANGNRIPITLSAVGGHVFSIEAKSPLRPIAFARGLAVEDLSISEEIMVEHTAPSIPGMATMDSHPGE